jgi:hypothetical protein
MFLKSWNVDLQHTSKPRYNDQQKIVATVKGGHSSKVAKSYKMMFGVDRWSLFRGSLM